MQVTEKKSLKKVNKAMLFLLSCSPTLKITITKVSKKDHLLFVFLLGKQLCIFLLKRKKPNRPQNNSKTTKKITEKTTV